MDVVLLESAELLTDYQFKADSAQICCSDGFIQSSLDQAVIEGSHRLPGHLTEEHHQEDVASGDGDAWHQSHPAKLRAETEKEDVILIF